MMPGMLMPAVPVTAAVSTGGQEVGSALQPRGSDLVYGTQPPFFPSSHHIHPWPHCTPHTESSFQP